MRLTCMLLPPSTSPSHHDLNCLHCPCLAPCLLHRDLLQSYTACLNAQRVLLRSDLVHNIALTLLPPNAPDTLSPLIPSPTHTSETPNLDFGMGKNGKSEICETADIKIGNFTAWEFSMKIVSAKIGKEYLANMAHWEISVFFVFSLYFSKSPVALLAAPLAPLASPVGAAIFISLPYPNTSPPGRDWMAQLKLGDARVSAFRASSARGRASVDSCVLE